MRVRFTASPGAALVVTTKDGGTLTADDIDSIEVLPFFATRAGPGEVFSGEVISDVRGVVDKFALMARGFDGKLGRRDNANQGVVPLVDQVKKTKKKKSQPTTTTEKVA